LSYISILLHSYPCILINKENPNEIIELIEIIKKLRSLKNSETFMKQPYFNIVNCFFNIDTLAEKLTENSSVIPTLFDYSGNEEESKHFIDFVNFLMSENSSSDILDPSFKCILVKAKEILDKNFYAHNLCFDSEQLSYLIKLIETQLEAVQDKDFKKILLQALRYYNTYVKNIQIKLHHSNN
jgi:hypothetical protein